MSLYVEELTLTIAGGGGGGGGGTISSPTSDFKALSSIAAVRE